MEQSYKEKYENILARLERAKNDNDVCDERFCCVIDEIIPELAESEDEKIRREIINYFQCQSEEEPTRKEIHNKWITWLENIPYTIDHEKREGFHLGYRAALDYAGGFCVLKKNEQRMVSAEESLGVDSETYNKIVDECIFGEKKPEENKGNIGGISPNWSVEDKVHIESVLERLEGMCKKGATFTATRFAVSQDIDWLKSLKGRVQPQPKQEWSEEDEEILRTILSDGIRGAELDMLQVNWLKSLRPHSRWKPSSEQIGLLQAIVNEPNNAASESCKIVLKDILEKLKKLKEE